MGSPKPSQGPQQPDGFEEPWGFRRWSIKSYLWPICEPAKSAWQAHGRSDSQKGMVVFILACTSFHLQCCLPLTKTKKGTKHCNVAGEKKREIPNSFRSGKRRNTAEKHHDKTTFSAFIAPFLTLVLKAFFKGSLSYPAFPCIKRVVLPDIPYSLFLLCEMPRIKGTYPLSGFLGIYTTQLTAAGIEPWAGEWTRLGCHHERLTEAGAETLGAKGAQWLLRPTPEQAWAQRIQPEPAKPPPAVPGPPTTVPPARPDLRRLLPAPCRQLPGRCGGMPKQREQRQRHFSPHFRLSESNSRSHGGPAS